eukprot:scaffold189831_cov35-Tisochrysis_lutea.AAC.2
MVSSEQAAAQRHASAAKGTGKRWPRRCEKARKMEMRHLGSGLVRSLLMCALGLGRLSGALRLRLVRDALHRCHVVSVRCHVVRRVDVLEMRLMGHRMVDEYLLPGLCRCHVVTHRCDGWSWRNHLHVLGGGMLLGRSRGELLNLLFDGSDARLEIGAQTLLLLQLLALLQHKEVLRARIFLCTRLLSAVQAVGGIDS